MATHRISVDIDEDDHKHLKMYCASIGSTIKEFVINSTLDKLADIEDKLFIENIKKGGFFEEFNHPKKLA